MRYVVRTNKSKNFWCQKHQCFTSSIEEATKYRSYASAGHACQRVEVKTGIPCSYWSEIEVEEEVME